MASPSRCQSNVESDNEKKIPDSRNMIDTKHVCDSEKNKCENNPNEPRTFNEAKRDEKMFAALQVQSPNACH